MSNYYDNTKSNNIVTTNTNINAEANQESKQGNEKKPTNQALKIKSKVKE